MQIGLLDTYKCKQDVWAGTCINKTCEPHIYANRTVGRGTYANMTFGPYDKQIGLLPVLGPYMYKWDHWTWEFGTGTYM